MVKDGPFLNSNVDYKTKCSQLVHLKKSRKIFDDVSFSQVLSVPSEVEKIAPSKVDSFDHKSVCFIGTESLSDVADENMSDYEDDFASKDFHQVHPRFETPSLSGQEDENDSQMNKICSLLPADESFGHHVLEAEVGESAAGALINRSPDISQRLKEMVPQSPKGRFSRIETFEALYSPIVENSVSQEVVIKHQEIEAMLPSQNDEVTAAKLKMILRFVAFMI